MAQIVDEFGYPISSKVYTKQEVESYTSSLTHLQKQIENADTAYGVQGLGTTINDRLAHRNPISRLNVPKNTHDITAMSLKYADENYIVAHAVRLKKNFAQREMTIVGKETTQAHYLNEFRRLRLPYWLGRIYRQYFTCGRVVVYWGDDRPIRFVTILDPRRVRVISLMGMETVFLQPDPRWVTGMTGRDAGLKALLQKSLPAYWLPYIRKNQEIPLKDGSYSVIEKDLSQYYENDTLPSSISGVPLQPAFNALQVMHMLMAGDFSTAWLMKNLIALVSIGDPKNEKEYTRPDQTELNKLRSTFDKPEYSMWAFVDPTVDIRFITPDQKILSSEKYAHQIEIIERTMGLPPIFSNRDASYAGGSISLKPFRMEIENARADVDNQFFRMFLPLLREGYTRSKAGSKDPEIVYDQDSLKEDRVILDELFGKYDRGAISIESLLDGKTHGIEEEMSRKKDEEQYRDVVPPLYDMNHGQASSDDAGGRPISTGAGANNSEGVRGSATPRPSK